MGTYRFLGVPIAMHYVRTLCDKYFLSYDGFSWCLTGRFQHRVLKCGVGAEWHQRGTAAKVPFHFDSCLPYFMLLFSWNFDFSGTAYHRDSKPVPLDLACLKPYRTFDKPLGQADLQSDIPCPLVDASSGQKQYYIRSAWHLVSLWVRLTFSQMYPPVEASSGQEWYYIRSDWHLVSLWVRLTCLCEGKSGASSCSNSSSMSRS